MPDDVLSVTIGGRTVLQPIDSFETRFAWGNHSLVIVDLRFAPPFEKPVDRIDIVDEWTPASVVFGSRSGQLRSWYGYVHHHAVISDVTESEAVTLRYVLVGTSLPMDNERTRSWKSTTASSIARQVFQQHRLRTITSVHPRLLDYWAQPGISDFALLQGLADETGYRLWVDGSTGTFVNPRTLLSSPSSRYTSTFRQDRAKSGADTLLNFRILTGTMVPRSNGTSRQPTVNGLDRRTGRTLMATGGGTTTLQTVVSDRAVDNFSEAQSIATAARLNTQGWITATADVFGDASLHPGSLANLQGRALPPGNDGLWLVSGAVHRIRPNTNDGLPQFLTTLTLERDQRYAATFDRYVELTNTRADVPATIRDGIRWESEYLEDIRVK